MSPAEPWDAVRPLSDVLVTDLSCGIAGGYCVKLLVDAGARVERPDTPPSSRDSLSTLPEPLVAYLRCGGDSSHEAAESARRIVVEDRGPGYTERAAQLESADVLVSISPFGLTGPWAHLPANEFTLQALSGSIGGRGLPERDPVQSGGRLIEWAAGTYAAVAGLAALRTQCQEHVDVSMLESGVLVMAMYAYLAAAFGDRTVGAGRVMEVPSVLPTRDGFVGVCTVTAQQFEDFLLMIDRADLLADPELRVAPLRFARREEFLTAVHAWSSQQTVAEVLETASAFRVPAAPVTAGTDVLSVDHFQARGVFVPNASGYLQPRRPYRLHAGPRTMVTERSPRERPLQGVRVVDLTAFLAGPAASHVLAALGADVVKIESPARPDGMRAATTRRHDPQWQEWGMVFHGVNSGKRSAAIDLAVPDGRDLALRLVADADVVIENFTPRVLDNLRLSEADLRAANPAIIVVRMPAFGLDGPWRDRSGFAQSMEQACGLAAITGYPDGQPMLPRGPCDPIAGMHATFALLTALEQRRRTGTGSLVEVPMVEAILNVAAEGLLEAQRSGQPPARLGNRSAVAALQGVYPCQDEQWVAISVESDAQWLALVAALGHPPPLTDQRFAVAASRHQHHDELDDHLRQCLQGMSPATIAADLLAAGVPAAPVVLPRDVAELEQLCARGFFEELEHPVVGRQRYPGVPFRFSSRSAPWLEIAPPTIGQHTVQVLSAVGVSTAELAALRERRVIAGD